MAWIIVRSKIHHAGDSLKFCHECGGAVNGEPPYIVATEGIVFHLHCGLQYQRRYLERQAQIVSELEGLVAELEGTSEAKEVEKTCENCAYYYLREKKGEDAPICRTCAEFSKWKHGISSEE